MGRNKLYSSSSKYDIPFRDSTSTAKLGKQLVKRAALFTASYEAVAISKAMEKVSKQNKMTEENQEAIERKNFEFLLKEQGVVSIKETLNSLLELLVTNSVAIDDTLINNATTIMGAMDYLLQLKEEHENGNQA